MIEEEIWTIYKVTKRTTWEISNQGNVKKNGILIDFSYIPENEYIMLGIGRIHRLVAEIYIPNPDNKPCIDHINGDKHDNRACNLRWVTYSENMMNPITRKRRSKSMKGIIPWNKGKKGVQVAWNKGKHSALKLERDELGRFKKQRELTSI